VSIYIKKERKKERKKKKRKKGRKEGMIYIYNFRFLNHPIFYGLYPSVPLFSGLSPF
jgi:hypothetical protein